jgi:hypothetical protein
MRGVTIINISIVIVVRPLLLRCHGLLHLLFDVVDKLVLVVLGSHHRLPLLGDQWVMASSKPSPIYMELSASTPKRHAISY